jgi:hypothetical protein
MSNWIPLESNPDVLNEYLHKLGINAHHLCFQDVYGLDEELLVRDVVTSPDLTSSFMKSPLGNDSSSGQEFDSFIPHNGCI